MACRTLPVSRNVRLNINKKCHINSSIKNNLAYETIKFRGRRRNTHTLLNQIPKEKTKGYNS
jgi:hypothetical protein